jgi:hypothetical protein
MSVPVVHQAPASEKFMAFIERHDTLRMVMQWLTDRFADEPEVDDTIAWEDGEEHDEADRPSIV